MALAAAEPVGSTALQYLNRLSDLLFLLARATATAGGGALGARAGAERG